MNQAGVRKLIREQSDQQQKRRGGLQQARRWLMGVALAACAGLLLLAQLGWGSELDGQLAAEREQMREQSSARPLGNEGDAGVSDDVRAVVEPLLTQYVEQAYHPDFSGGTSRRYASMHLIGVEHQPSGQMNVYAWLLLEGLEHSGDEWHTTAGLSAPIRFTIEPHHDGYRVASHKLPKDGSLYASSLQAMFPDQYLKKLNELTRTPELHNRFIDELHERNLQKAEQMHGVK